MVVILEIKYNFKSTKINNKTINLFSSMFYCFQEPRSLGFSFEPKANVERSKIGESCRPSYCRTYIIEQFNGYIAQDIWHYF